MNNIEEISQMFNNVKAKKPLIHHITNYVTVNNCANATLAIGASPIMADDVREVCDITSVSSALVINMGTLNERTVESMIKAGKTANNKKIPVVFDPVGAGASIFRNKTAERIIEEVKVSIIRGNISEIKFLCGLSSNTKGVDAGKEDNEDDAVHIAKKLSKDKQCIVAITGKQDVITDGNDVLQIDNGHSELTKITGTGCMCTSLIASFAGANPDKCLLSAAAGIMCMGISGELAYISENIGTGTYHHKIMDEISKLDANTIIERAKIHES